LGEERKEMKKPSIVALTLVIFTLALATVALAGDAFAGTWNVNLAESQFNPGPPPKSDVLTITSQDNGIKVMIDTVHPDGTTFHAEFTAKFDVKDYPLLGTSMADTVALNRINTNTWGEVLKKAGKEVASSHNVVSKDGKTLTRTVKEKNAKGQDVNDTYVYDKQ
jgi:hypothetical protein